MGNNSVNWGDMWNSWGNVNGGGMGMSFGGGMGMPFGGAGFGCAWCNGFNFGNVGDWWGGSSSSSDSNLSKEEKKAKELEKAKLDREFLALKGLLEALYKDESILSFSEREDLKYDVTHLEGKDKKEKFESLKVIYNKYKETIKNNLGKLGEMSKDFTGIGYESETGIDERINELSSAINDVNKENLAGFTTMENVEVLDLLSSWNSNSSVNSKHLMETVIDKYNNLDSSETDANEKKQSLERFAKALKSKLSEKARKLANNAMLKDETLKNQLKALGSALDVAPLQSCADKFEDLYEACRIAGAKIMENTYKEKYEFLGRDNLFENILADTIEDLKNEGYDGEVSNDIKAPIDLSDKTLEEQVQALVGEGTLREVTINDAKFYEEVIPTGERTYRRVFEIDDGKLKECVNIKISDDNTLAWADGDGNDNNTYTTTDVNATTIQSDVNNAKQTYSNDLDSVVTFLGMKKESSQIEVEGKKYAVYSVKIGTETKKYARTENGFHEITNNSFDINSPLSKAELIKQVYSQTSGARDKGKQTAKDLIGYTSTDDQNRVTNCINNDINAVNVWEFLKGYQANHGGGERFFDQLDNENGWDENKKKDLMRKVLNYCIDNLKARIEADPARKDEYEDDIKSLETYRDGISEDKTDYEDLDSFTYKYVKEHRDFCS